MRVLKIVLLSLLALAAAIYIAYCVQLWSVQRRMMFPGAQMGAVADSSDWPANARQLKLGDAQRVRAIWLPANAGASASTIVFFHGNAEFAHQSVAAMSRLVGGSRNLLSLEYPGYAGAPGEPTLASIRDASLIAYDWLLGQPGVDPQRIVVVGRSVGGGPAAELSRHRPLAALVLVSTFTSIADMARSLYAPSFLIRDPFDNRSAVAAFAGPALILHGQRDDVIPYAYGVALGKASPRAEFVALPCAHNDCALDGAALRDALAAFLEKHQL
jgi:fermentation-respiration switch protein FrsA (DUF1100 family)